MTGLPNPGERLQSWSAGFLAFTMAAAVSVMFILRLWINPTLFQTLLFSLGAVWAIAFTIQPFELRFNVILIPLACTVAWGLAQLAAGWTNARTDTWITTLSWVGNLVAFFLAMQVCAHSRIRWRFLNALLYFAFVLSVVSVLQYFSWNGKIYWTFLTYDSVALGPFINRDQYAAFIEMILPLALVQALEGGSRSLRFIVISAAIYATVIAGASRAGALLCTAEIVVVPMLLWTKGRLEKGAARSATVNVWLLTVVFVAVVGWAVVFARFEDPDPLKGRREILHDTIAMIHARPSGGFGLGLFPTAYPAFGSQDFGLIVNHAHNDWAEWAADGGIPFFLLVLSIALWTVPKAFKTVWGIGMLAVFVHSFVDFPLQKPVLELWQFALLGVMAAETRGRRAKPAG